MKFSMIVLAVSVVMLSACSSPAQWANARDTAAGTGIWAKNEAKQYAQSAKKHDTIYNIKDVQVVKKSDGNITVNGKLAALDETETQANTYSQGLYQIIVYKNGKVALMENGRFIGYMKKTKII